MLNVVIFFDIGLSYDIEFFVFDGFLFLLKLLLLRYFKERNVSLNCRFWVVRI